MTKRKTSPLACADYVSKYPEESGAVLAARLHLLKAIERTYPSLLKALATDVFPLYSQCADEQLRKFGFHNRSQGAALYRTFAEDPGVKSALLEWETSFNITEEWLKERAISTLWAWRAEKTAVLKWKLIETLWRDTVQANPFELRVDGWEMEILTWSAYKQSVCAAVEQKLAEYNLEASKLAESKDLIRTPRTYSVANFNWFVQYQFAGMSSVKIVANLAKTEKGVFTDESTVMKGVKAAAELVSWEHLRNRKTR